MNHNEIDQHRTERSKLRKHLRNAALLVLGITIAYVLTTFLR